jgi:hypothetical protein
MTFDERADRIEAQLRDVACDVDRMQRDLLALAGGAAQNRVLRVAPPLG